MNNGSYYTKNTTQHTKNTTQQQQNIICIVCKINSAFPGNNKCNPCANPNIEQKYMPIFRSKTRIPTHKTPDDPFTYATIFGGDSSMRNCIGCCGTNTNTEFRSGNTIGPK